MNKYRRGRQAEYRLCNLMEKQGWEAQRSAGSHSAFDVVAWNKTQIKFCQVKSSRDGYYSPAQVAMAREEMESLPRLAGMSCELWLWAGFGRSGRWVVYDCT